MRLDFGGVTRHPATGKLGARLRVHLPMEGGWSGHYEMDTHGLSPQGVGARIAELRAYHAAKAARLTSFQNDIVGRVFDGVRCVDCTIGEQGARVRLYVDVRDDGGGKLTGFPITRRFATINDVPSNAEIIVMIHAIAAEHVAAQEQHARFVERVVGLTNGGE